MTLSIKQTLKKYENTALFSEYSKHVADNCTFFTFNYPYLVCMDVGGAVARDRRFGFRSLTHFTSSNLPDFDLAGTESRGPDPLMSVCGFVRCNAAGGVFVWKQDRKSQFIVTDWIAAANPILTSVSRDSYLLHTSFICPSSSIIRVPRSSTHPGILSFKDSWFAAKSTCRRSVPCQLTYLLPHLAWWVPRRMRMSLE